MGSAGAAGGCSAGASAGVVGAGVGVGNTNAGAGGVIATVGAFIFFFIVTTFANSGTAIVDSV